MNWDNLIKNKCPKCEYALVLDSRGEGHLNCENPGCGFRCRKRKADDIADSVNRGSNLAALNNLGHEKESLDFGGVEFEE